MRVLLVAALVLGMSPDLTEVGEAVVHYVRTGHVAHTGADHGDLGDQGPEHGCGGAHHRCTCCPSQPLVGAPRTAPASLQEAPARPLGPPAPRPVAREPSRPFRPPIA